MENLTPNENLPQDSTPVNRPGDRTDKGPLGREGSSPEQLRLLDEQAPIGTQSHPRSSREDKVEPPARGSTGALRTGGIAMNAISGSPPSGSPTGSLWDFTDTVSGSPPT